MVFRETRIGAKTAPVFNHYFHSSWRSVPDHILGLLSLAKLLYWKQDGF